MDTTKESPTVLSLCPGLLLGLDRGFEAALGRKPRTVAYVEIEAFIVDNLIAAMEECVLDAAPVWSNLKTFPWHLLRGKVDWILGGYPCQPFSVAGSREGIDDPRHLYPYISTGVRAIRPMGCFFENVSGHLTLGYEFVRRDLQSMGYRVEEGIFSAEEVGAPHRRERLFILAILGDAKSLYAQGCFGRQKQGKSWRTDYESIELGYSKNGSGKEIKIRKSKGQLRLRSFLHNYRRQISNDDMSVLQDDPQWNSDNWPAGQGSQQYDFEEPRTIESGMGCTINGYNFREDILRGEGNGVVWQTAKLAFRTLLKKHLNGRTNTK